MSVEDDKPEVDPAAAGGPDEAVTPAQSGLPRPVQEHLGQQLRTSYQTMAEKPAFLGDTIVPPELDRHLQRLETREKIRHKGLEAVRTALGGDDPETDPRPGERDGR